MDFVAVATGQFSDKNIISHPSQDGFAAAGGQVMHSSEYTNPDMVRGKRVVVLGGGAIGLLTAMTYQSMGIENVRIAEPNPTRAKLCADVTGLEVYNPLTDAPEDGSIDLVFDAVGSGRTRAASCALVRPGGTIVHVGLQDNGEGIDTRRITLQEVTFFGTYCYTPDDFAHSLHLLATGQVTGEGWTEFRPLDAGAQSFKDVDDGTAPPKIILTL